MPRKYYSSRKNPKSLTLEQLFHKLKHLFFYYRGQDYFKAKAGITSYDFPDQIKHRAAISLNFDGFPIDQWDLSTVTEDHIFDMIEFLYDHISKPIGWSLHTTEGGYNCWDYEEYDENMGRKEFREDVNTFINEYGPGYELAEDGLILALASNGLQDILDAEIMPFDEANVDSKVKAAIRKWRNRRLDLGERRQAVRELADVFEWLKKSGHLSRALRKKDESAIFEIANNFAIRHHDPRQKRDYDEAIWYSWIFHFYLATYHAVMRILKKLEG